MIASKTTEKTVLGLILDKPELFIQTPQFRPELFTEERYVLASAIKDLAESGRNFDTASVSSWLNSKAPDVLDAFGGPSGLLELQTDIPFASYDFESYISELEEKLSYREIDRLGRKLREIEVEHEGQSSLDYINSIQEELIQISQNKRIAETLTTFTESSRNLLGELVDLASMPPGTLNGLSTGFNGIDSYLLGLREGQLVLVAARPSVGKTAFALNMAADICFNQNKPVLFFSLEMSQRELTQRVLSFRANVPHDKILTGKMSENDWAAIAKAMRELNDCNFYIDDNTAVKLTDIRTRCNQIKSEHGEIGAIFLDYIQLMTGEDKREFNRVNIVSEITRGLKIIASEFDCPVIALSQLNRNLESRPNKRPIMSDLRESGGIEQDSSVIMALYRDEIYYPDTADQGIAEVDILKNRSGGRGVVRLGFLNNYAQFINLAQAT